jgi:hypothetical protein
MQTVQKINLRKQRDFNQKLNATFAFLRQNVKALATCLFQIAGPFLVVSAILYGALKASVVHVPGGIFGLLDSQLTFTLFLVGLLCLLSFILAFSAIAGVTLHFMLLYMENDDLRITPAMVWQRVKNDLPMLCFTALGYSFFVVAGFILIIPGIYLYVGLMLIYMIRIAEKESFMESVRRSLHLVSGKWWSTFGLLLIIQFVISILSFVFALPDTIVTVIAELHKTTELIPGDASYLTPLTFATTVISFLGTYSLYSITFIAMAFQYFNLVEQKEAVGLLQQIEKLGAPKPTADDKEDY